MAVYGRVRTGDREILLTSEGWKTGNPVWDGLYNDALPPGDYVDGWAPAPWERALKAMAKLVGGEVVDQVIHPGKPGEIY